MRILYFLFLTLITTSVSAQDFPKKFIGLWTGDLHWYKTGESSPQKVKMQLIILPTDTVGQYTWQIIYGENNSDNRPYVLKLVDSAKGHWKIDEKNGIVLDQYWVGNRFTSAFTVLNSTIINSYRIERKKLVVEFYSISAQSINTTGNGTPEVPHVNSYAVKSYQRAVLRKVKKGSVG